MALGRIAVLVSMLGAGCDALFRLGEVELPPGDPDAQVGQDGSSLCVEEHFDGTLAELAVKWNRTLEPGCTPNFVNNELQLPLPQNLDCFGRLKQRMRVSMVGASLEVHAVELLTATSNAEAWMALNVDELNYYEFYYNPTNLTTSVVVNNKAMFEVDETYDPLLHTYWRIEHRPNAVPAPTLAFRVSADRTNWIDLNEIPIVLPLDSLEIELGTGAYNGGVPTPQLSRFDDVIYCSP